MIVIKLKQQYLLRIIDQQPYLTSENVHHSVDAKYLPVLTKLVTGIPADEIEDDDFEVVEQFNQLGFLTTSDDPYAPFWELARTSPFDVAAQFKHVTVNVLDLTPNGVGAELVQDLQTAGLTVADKPRLTIVVANSYLSLPECPTPTLPVICNRIKLSLGPMIFPWGSHVRDLVAKNAVYLDKLEYPLPPAFDKLQRALISTFVIRFIALRRLTPVNNIIEYNLITQKKTVWPV